MSRVPRVSYQLTIRHPARGIRWKSRFQFRWVLPNAWRRCAILSKRILDNSLTYRSSIGTGGVGFSNIPSPHMHILIYWFHNRVLHSRTSNYGRLGHAGKPMRLRIAQHPLVPGVSLGRWNQMVIHDLYIFHTVCLTIRQVNLTMLPSLDISQQTL